MRTAVEKASANVKVVSHPEVMGGDPTVFGTRIPAETVVANLRAGHTDQNILKHYPTLPPGAIDAVKRWAEREHGAGRLDQVTVRSSSR